MYKFGYQWEDPTIEEKCFDKNNHQKILLVSSGGETLFHLLYKFGEFINCIDCVDFNSNQNELVNKKIQDMMENKVNDYSSVFENMLHYSYHNNSWNDTMSKSNLIATFTENAVKYTSKSFANHFKKRVNEMEQNYFFDLIVNKSYLYFKPEYLTNTSKVIKHFDKVKFHVIDIIKYLEECNTTYDFINLSNITDWLSQKDVDYLLSLVYERLEFNGVCIIRKLLSDNIIINNKFQIFDFSKMEKTNFYTQTLALFK